MQLPRAEAHYRVRVNYGTYLSCRLRQAKSPFAADVRAATDAVEKAGEELNHLHRPVQEALADRDAIDDTLDLVAQQARLALASRGLDATKKSRTRISSRRGLGITPRRRSTRRCNAMASSGPGSSRC